MKKIYILGEVFITGVPLFFFISGFLTGLKEKVDKKWLKKRAIRILTPFYIWVLPGMLILWLVQSKNVSIQQFVFLITNMQGLNYVYWRSELYEAVVGFGHLWFVTIIMLCYLLVPLVEKVMERRKRKSKWIFVMGVVIIVIQPFLTEMGFQVSYIVTFFIGYMVSKLKYKVTKKIFALLTLLCTVVTLLRFLLMYVADGSNYYDRYFALLSASIIGIWIFTAVFFIASVLPKVVHKFANNRGIAFLSAISYEIYIVHCWFLEGKWQISYYIKNPLIANGMVIMLTFIFASLLHYLAKKITSILYRKV